MHISFAGKKIRLLALAVTIFMIIFVSANWRLYLDPTLDLTCGTILFVLSLLAGPVAGFLIIFKPSVDDKYKAHHTIFRIFCSNCGVRCREVPAHFCCLPPDEVRRYSV